MTFSKKIKMFLMVSCFFIDIPTGQLLLATKSYDDGPSLMQLTPPASPIPGKKPSKPFESPQAEEQIIQQLDKELDKLKVTDIKKAVDDIFAKLEKQVDSVKNSKVKEQAKIHLKNRKSAYMIRRGLYQIKYQVVSKQEKKLPQDTDAVKVLQKAASVKKNLLEELSQKAKKITDNKIKESLLEEIKKLVVKEKPTVIPEKTKAAPSLKDFKISEKQEVLWRKVVERVKQLKKRDPKEAKAALQKLRELSGVKMSEKVGLGIVVDDGFEKPTDEKLEALTSDLGCFLKLKKISVLASASLYFNLLCRKAGLIPEDLMWKSIPVEVEDISFSEDVCSLFDFPGTQFILYVPKGEEEKIKRYLNVDEKNRLVIDASNRYKNLISFLNKKPQSEIKDLSQFDIIFKATVILEKEGITASLVVGVSGHGAIGAYIAGFPVRLMQGLLDFFKRRAWFVFITSCYGGGQNIEFLRFWDKDRKIYRLLPYTLVVQGITDIVTYDNFSLAVLLYSIITERSIEDGLEKVQGFLTIEGGIHAHAHVVQVLFPYAIRFVSLEIAKFIISLGPVLLNVHRLEKRPLTLWALRDEEKLDLWGRFLEFKETKDIAKETEEIKSPLLILSAFKNIDLPIRIRPFVFPASWRSELWKSELWKVDQWQQFSVAYEKVKHFYENNKKWLENAWKNYFSRDDYEKLELGIKQDFYNHKRFIFPAILPVHRAKKAVVGVKVEQQFSIIDVHSYIYPKGKAHLLPVVGVLAFIRDAFFDTNQWMRSLNVFKIKEIKGINDISLLLAMMRKEKGDDNENELEIALQKEIKEKQEELKKETIAEKKKKFKKELEELKKLKKEITLRDVLAEVGYEDGKIVGRLKFSFENKISFEDKDNILKGGKNKVYSVNILRAWKTSGLGWDFNEDYDSLVTMFKTKKDEATRLGIISLFKELVGRQKAYSQAVQVVNHVWESNRPMVQELWNELPFTTRMIAYILP